MRSRVSAAFAAGGRPGPRLAVYGTVKLCHTRTYAGREELPGRCPAIPNQQILAWCEAPSCARNRRGETTRVDTHGQRRFSGVVLRDGPRCAVRSGVRRAETRRGVQPAGRHDRILLPLLSSWSAYTKELVAHWLQVRTVRGRRSGPCRTRSAAAHRQADAGGLALPHGAEAAIRVWSALDPHVHAVQAAVDQAALRHHVRVGLRDPAEQAAGRAVRGVGRVPARSATSRPPCPATPPR